MYQAYVTRYVFGCSIGGGRYNCLEGVEQLLYIIFGIRFLVVIWSVFYPYFMMVGVCTCVCCDGDKQQWRNTVC